MRTRNILAMLGASLAVATAASAQDKPAARPAAKVAASTARTATKSDAKVSADSARRIVITNAAGATVKSEHMRQADGRSVYVFRLTEGKNNEAFSATVDAETGAYTRVVPSKPGGAKATSTRKP